MSRLKAIAQALPHLHLFRCTDLAQHLHTSRADKLLREVRDAARIGRELIDEQKGSGTSRVLSEPN